MLAWKPFEKTTIKNDRTEMLPNPLSKKTVVQFVRPEMLAAKASEKTINWNDVLKCCPKLYPQNKFFEMSVPKC